jgi:hypothetical protein
VSREGGRKHERKAEVKRNKKEGMRKGIEQVNDDY